MNKKNAQLLSSKLIIIVLGLLVSFTFVMAQIDDYGQPSNGARIITVNGPYYESGLPSAEEAFGGRVHNAQESFDAGIAVNQTEVINSSGVWTGAVSGSTGAYSSTLSVTGAFTGSTGDFSSTLDVTGAAGFNALVTLTQDQATSTANYEEALRLYRNPAAVTAGDTPQQGISFYGDTSRVAAGDPYEIFRIEVDQDDVAVGSEEASLMIKGRADNASTTWTTAYEIDSLDHIWNTNQLVLDYSLGFVGIGDATPLAGLQVGSMTPGYATTSNDLAVAGVAEFDQEIEQSGVLSDWITGDITDATTTLISVVNPMGTDLYIDDFYLIETGAATSAGAVTCGTSSTGYLTADPTDLLIDDFAHATSTTYDLTNGDDLAGTGFGGGGTNSEDKIVWASGEYITCYWDSSGYSADAGGVTGGANTYAGKYMIHWVKYR